MGIRSTFFETSNSPRTCLGWIIAICIAIAFLLWDSTSYNLKPDGPTIELTEKATLFHRFDTDTLKQVLPVGDKVKVLGIDRSSFGQKWLVETNRGEIGWIDASDLNSIRQIVTDGSCKGDTVTICGTGKDSSSFYLFKDMAGEEHKCSTKNFVPVLDGWDDYAYNRDGVAGICTQNKFETKSIGNNFNEINKEFGYPVLLHSTPDGFEAAYSWKVFDPSTGGMLKSIVTFSKDSIASNVRYSSWTTRGASWLKRLPLASAIIDCPITSVMIRDSRYDAISDPTITGWRKAGAICMIPILLLALFLWMFFTPAIPVLLMGWLMRFPAIFSFLSDRWLKVAMGVVAIVACYIWCVLMMAWGMFPFWSILIVLITRYCFQLASSPLCHYPHVRCPKCHNLYSIIFDHRVFKYDEIKKGHDIVRDRLLGTRTEKWKAWTQVTTTTTYRDGHKEVKSHRQDEHTKAQDFHNYLYIDYEVTYRLDHYCNYYKCRHCGHVEDMEDVEYTELSREKAGTHTAEVSGDIYRARW